MLIINYVKNFLNQSFVFGNLALLADFFYFIQVSSLYSKKFWALNKQNSADVDKTKLSLAKILRIFFPVQ